MIEGERGEATLARIAALRMDALLDGDEVSCTMIAACFADAIRKGDTPRDVANGLIASLPSDAAWESHIRDQLIEAVDLWEEQTAA